MQPFSFNCKDKFTEYFTLIHYCRGRLVILCWLSYPAEKIPHRPVFINLRNLCVQKCRLFPVQLRRQCPYLLNAGWTTFAVLSPKHMQDCNLRRTHGPGINYGNVMRASGCTLETCRYYACANIFPKKFKTSNPIGQNIRVARQLATLSLPVYRFSGSAMLGGGRLLKPVRKIKRQAVNGEENREGDRRRGWRQVSYARLGCRGITRITLDRKRR